MKTGCLIQDLRRIDLNNLVTSKEGGSFIIGEVTNPNVSPSVGDASLVIEGEEFAGRIRAAQLRGDRQKVRVKLPSGNLG